MIPETQAPGFVEKWHADRLAYQFDRSLHHGGARFAAATGPIWAAASVMKRDMAEIALSAAALGA